MRNLWDVVRAHVRPGAMVVAGEKNGKPVLMAAGTDEAVAAGFDAGALIKAMGPAIKGGGGGKPTMAQAGGKDASASTRRLRSRARSCCSRYRAGALPRSSCAGGPKAPSCFISG